MDDMAQSRTSPAALEGAARAPDAYARAEQERQVSEAARASGDLVAASLHAQHAIAGYQRAFIIAREARATVELADAEKALADATATAQELDSSVAKLDAEAQQLETRARVARDKVLPAPSGSTTKELEAARAVAAQSLGASAHLLCGAAQLVATDADGLPDAMTSLRSLDERLAATSGRGLIDDAARARARCLDALTRARRGKAFVPGTADTLLSELSANGSWEPSPDERGVVVAIQGAFAPTTGLTANAIGKLAELAHVAVAHPEFGVQVVIHDAVQPRPNDHRDSERADAAVRALVDAGVPAARIQIQLAGARLPVLDPADKTASSRNERLEIAFVD
jgi:flagellar motor protein MotB